VHVTQLTSVGDTYLSVKSADIPAGTTATLVYIEDDADYNEVPLFQNRDEVNTYLGANGIIGALNTANGWVLWGNNTSAFPGNTDVKDSILSERRMFNYVKNSFQLFAQPRIDNPLNRRQLEGVVNAFNQILASLQGFGALNAASVTIDDERNTTEQLIRGVVYFRIRIAPPPPMQEINGVFEFDVPGFEASLA
jgi:phage tail sheath protein FI